MKDDCKHLLDWGAISIAWANLFDFLPHILAFCTSILSFAWLVMRMIETGRNLGWIEPRTKRTRKDDCES